jgi:hypothetical protein
MPTMLGGGGVTAGAAYPGATAGTAGSCGVGAGDGTAAAAAASKTVARTVTSSD